MATIRKRSNRKGIVWQIDYYDPQGKRVMRCFPKKTDAEAYLGKVLAAKKEGRYEDVFDLKKECRPLLTSYAPCMWKTLEPKGHLTQVSGIFWLR